MPVNCAGLPETLLESELFGHVKGSFTGAFRDKPGKLELADRGTVFMDEIGEMTLRMQGLLLRFLETGELQKVGGGRHDGRVDVRVVAATNRNLQEMIAAGTFREDLFYRLNVIHLRVPALRERREDIPALVQHFMTVYGNQNGNGNGSVAANGSSSSTTGGANGNHRRGSVVQTMSPEALALLTQYSWPGNVRELENVIERLTVTGRSADRHAAGPAARNPALPDDQPCAPQGAPPDGRRRFVQEARGRTSVLLAGGLSPLHAA